MFVVVDGRKDGIVQPEHLGKPIPLIPLLARRVHLLVELRRGDVQLVRIDADDGPILLMQVADVEGVLAVQGVDVVVEFVPGLWSDRHQVALRIQHYQNVNAASLGPGNEAIGLR